MPPDSNQPEENPVLKASRERRAKFLAELEKLTEKPTKESRSLTDEESARFTELASKVKKLDKDIRNLEAEEDRKAKAAAASAGVPEPGTPPVVVKREQMTYDQHGPNSYFRDLAYIAAQNIEPSYMPMAEQARARIIQHNREIEVEARRDAEVARRLKEIRSTPPIEQRVNPNTSAGTGGELVPPLWLVSQYVPFVRPGRVFANRVQNLPLPPGIDVINLPKITVGSQAGIQTAQGAAVVSVDIQTSTVAAPVRTIAGQEDISMQLLEQSPLAMDNVVFDDLTRDYDQRLDIQIVSGSGANGQHTGVLNVTGSTSNTSITNSNLINCSATTFGSAAGDQYRAIVNGVNQIETLRFMPPTAIWVHPRRANSWAFAFDSNNRPVFQKVPYGPWNALGVNESNPVPEGMAGELYGLPVIKDANMTTSANGTGSPASGGTQDCIVVLKEDDLYLWEGTMRLRALPEILSGTLQIRYQAYAYSAFMPNRFPPSLSICVGAGTAVPGF